MKTHHLKIAAVTAVLLLGAEADLRAGGVHVHYKPGAPAKMARANIGYYRGVLNLYHNRPVWFRQHHPFYAKMFDHPAVLQKVLRRWQAHPQRFEYWHDCLWKVLDGYAASHPVLPPAAPSQSNGETGSTGSGGTSEQNLNPPPSGNQGGDNPPPPPASVPEPSSAVLLLAGLGALYAGRSAWRRRRASLR